MTKLIDTWLAIGKKNWWIQEACDPEFTKSSFCNCNSLAAMVQEIIKGNYCLGQAFYHDNICLMQQVDGGDEWLVIKEDTAFESFTVGAMGFEGTLSSLKSIERSSVADCKALNYK
jgi:hypothetical protein